jgi:Ca-activated chloride channel family protein
MMAVVETGLQWRQPWWFALSLLVVAVVVIRHRHRLRVALATTAVAASAQTPLPVTWRQRLQWLPGCLQMAALMALLLALARPVVVESEPPARLGRDVLLCFDRSSSMAALDLDPVQTRLTVGKQLAAEFLRGRVDDRLGIITFARFADLVCPPTADHSAVAELLDAVQLVDAEGPEDATAIGAAVGMAANLLQRSATVGKVIVLLTDGEENVATAGAPDQIAPLHAGQWCRDHDIRVHAIALGRGELGADGTWRALDTTAVQQLAKISGGRFFPAADTATLRSVYAEIDRLEAVQFAEPGVRVIEWFAVPTWFALTLLAIAHLLRNSRMAVMS